ncbi:MAG TPA: NAD-dependent epimerase/dehydratase family protein [Pseudomonadota bacterium]|nr:NAD-dependent epimerase/dehydratase family protein [Pseudomonadota bacterium]HNF97868.1 NAD-dependent epimerase/dehydratase family protein [Pseudomonadota bacterium]HNN50873.1 NAD-dependent epimerase/dehydratase family protein [Pseudomonadota bacterium]
MNANGQVVEPSSLGPVLVTGGTGFLGEHLLRALRGKGKAVRVLTREPTPELRELSVSVYQGDLLSDANRAEKASAKDVDLPENEALDAALDGVKEVYHLAGMVSRDPARTQTMMHLHVDGTRRLLHACKRAGVRRVLLASTSGTIAISREADPIPDESWPYPVDLCGEWPYYLSKIYQEKLALELAPKLGLELVVVNPSLLLGPGDRRGSSTMDVRRFLCNEIPAVPAGGINFVDVRDVAPACVAAMERGRNGQRYLLGGMNWTFAEFLGRLGRIARMDGPWLKLPSRWNRLFEGAVKAVDELYRHRGQTSPIERISFEMSQHYWYCDSSLAMRELGFATRDPAETLDDTIRDVRKSLRY